MPAALLSKYKVIIEYNGLNPDYGFKPIQKLEGMLSFNLGISDAEILLQLTNSNKTLKYKNWEEFEKEWSVIERDIIT